MKFHTAGRNEPQKRRLRTDAGAVDPALPGTAPGSRGTSSKWSASQVADSLAAGRLRLELPGAPRR